MQNETITFSFGENWMEYLDTLSDDAIRSAHRDIEYWLGEDQVAGKTVIDIGSGSGLHSLIFYQMGAAKVHSIDVDNASVAATQMLWEKAGKPSNWIVEYGSILDRTLVESLEQYDIVYSWGVLHHTGAMWEAIENSAGLVRPGGKFWIALYVKGPRYEEDLALKRKYNQASDSGKRTMERQWIAKIMARRTMRLKNPFAWNQMKDANRGMNTYHDIVDWLGGLPYEVASSEEVEKFGNDHGFALERQTNSPEGHCNTYVFTRID